MPKITPVLSNQFINKFNVLVSNTTWNILLIISMVIVLVGIRIHQYKKSPDVIFLQNRAEAQWIKFDSQFELIRYQINPIKCGFRYNFNLNNPVDNAIITVQALKQCQIIFDGVTIFSSDSDFNNWKRVNDVAVPFTVNPGQHEIIIIVISNNSHPSVIAYSDKLPIRTGAGWFASTNGKNWQSAETASQIKEAAVSRKFPAAVDAFIKIMPYLIITFIIVFLILLLHTMYGDNAPKFAKWWIEPSHIRLSMLVLWAVMAGNNMFKIDYRIGYDLQGHLEYISYIVERHSLPLASDGWQMFQAPLNYIFNAPFYGFLIKKFSLPSVVSILRIIPFICGLLQIEIVYRAARLVFTPRKELQNIAIITGSLLPIHTYICQFVGNEPLAGCFISLLVLFCISLVMPDQKERGTKFFVVMGFVWGLALLSKMTAVLLAPVLIIVLIVHTTALQKPLKSSVIPIVTVLFFSILTASWYYFRNYIEFGNPFMGGWDSSRGIQWWQNPSYRTWSQLLYFGQSLSYPVYAGVKGFWDGVYSTLWLDGFNSGVIEFTYNPPWNKNFMAAGSLLALLPSIFIIAGVVVAILNKKAVYRNAAILSFGVIALFIAAMMDLYIRLPIYSTAKASYTLGLLPCYSILAAVGAEPFLKNKIIRFVIIPAFVCWGVAAYAAYFVIDFQQWN